MSEPLQRDALRVIQDIVRDAKGSPLEREAVRRVEAVLKAVAAGEVPPSAADACYSQREATILFADLRGFSAITSAYPTDVVLGVLNRCFSMMVEIIVRHYGTVDKFMGDAIMVVFHGDPSAPRDHARRAVLCAVEMQLAMNELRLQHRGEKVPDIYMGIGISTGNVMSGLIGSDSYRAYTVIGEEVNLASRIEAFSLRGQVLMSETTYEHCKDFVRVGEPMDVYVKGRAHRMRVREALGIPVLGKIVPRQDMRKSPRVAVRLDLQYWPVEGKVVSSAASAGVVRDISYHGLAAELQGALPLYSELKLAFQLPPLGLRADEIYSRVVSIREHDTGVLAGIEFTSLDGNTSAKIQLFVQMLLQGEYRQAV